MSSYASRRDVAVANEYLGSYMACRKCGQHATAEILSNLGGQCGGCFTQYCVEINPHKTPRTAAQRRIVAEELRTVLAAKASGISGGEAKTTARRLRQLEASGQRLTASQEWVLKCCEAKNGIGWTA